MSVGIMNLLFRVLLCCVYGWNENFLYFNTFIENRFILIIAAFQKKFNPVFAFSTFLQSYLQPGNKVILSVPENTSLILAPILVPLLISWFVITLSLFSFFTLLQILIMSKANCFDFVSKELSITILLLYIYSLFPFPSYLPKILTEREKVKIE